MGRRQKSVGLTLNVSTSAVFLLSKMPDTGLNIGGKVISLAQARRHGLSQRTDDELMELACANYQDAVTELMVRYHQRVRSYCRKWNPERGDDLAQDVFLKLWTARQSYRPQGQFPVYLFTIVRNVCRNASRTWFRRPLTETLSDSEAADHHADQLNELLAAERCRRVSREISKLPPKLREAVLLRFGEGLSYADISRIVDASEVTVRSRVHLGIDRLRGSCGE